MNKEEVITRVKTERSRWNDIMARIDDDLMLKPGVEGHWSAKDILAHVVWYEREMVGLLKARAFVGSDLWALPLDERNAGGLRGDQEHDPGGGPRRVRQSVP